MSDLNARMYAKSEAAKLTESLYQCGIVSTDKYLDTKKILAEAILVFYTQGKVAQLQDQLMELENES